MEHIIKNLIHVEHFPKSNVVYKDISRIIELNFSELIEHMLELTKDTLANADYIAGVESRGFIFASAMAYATKKGFIMIRKSGKLPPPTIRKSYSLEYGNAEIEMKSGTGNIIVVDDILATGGTILAAKELAEHAGYNVLGLFTAFNLKELNNLDDQVKYLINI